MLNYLLPILIIAILFFLYKNNQNSKQQLAYNLEAGKTFLASNLTKENVTQTDSGLQYEVLTKGTGEEHPKATSKVKVHYHGTLIDGSVFDSSVERGEPIEFGLNHVIKGWTEGVQLMVVGEKTRFYIPSELAYGNGSAGIITPGSTLVFEVELIDFK